MNILCWLLSKTTASRKLRLWNSWIILTAGILVLPAIECAAEINWAGDYYQFRYTATNEPTFYYFYPSDPLFEQPFSTNVKDESNSSFNSIASDQLSEFIGNPLPTSGANLKVEAWGPQLGTNPENGLMVQAYTDTIITDLNNEQGCDIFQEARTYVVRRFQVDQEKDYRVGIELKGATDFDSFFVSNHYRAHYIVNGEVEIYQIVNNDELTLLPGFPVDLDENHRRVGVSVTLRPFDDQQQPIIYQIKALLVLQSRVDNFELSEFLIAGEINGVYRVGTASAPFQLTAVIGDKFAASPAIPLLLLSD